jgi:hypothetical protein
MKDWRSIISLGRRSRRLLGKKPRNLRRDRAALGESPPKTGTVEAAWTCGLQR